MNYKANLISLPMITIFFIFMSNERFTYAEAYNILN